MECRGNILKINTSIEKSEEVKLYKGICENGKR